MTRLSSTRLCNLLQTPVLVGCRSRETYVRIYESGNLPKRPTRPRSIKMVLCPYLGLAHIKTAMSEQVTATYISNSIVVMAFHTSCGSSLVSWVFALRTTVTAPAIAMMTPQKSRFRKTSLKSKGAMTQFEINATTPSGLTMDAGAKPYAKKLPHSPTVIRTCPSHQ